MKSSAFKQGALTGLCGPYGVANAFSLLYPGLLSAPDASALAHRIAGALPCDFRTIMREGTDRGQMELMLAAAAEWTAERGWPQWSCRPMHPRSGQTAHSFWSDLSGRLTRGAAAIIGFGDHDRPNTRYEPHWTCVKRIGARTIHLLDSDEYEQVRLSATGVRPEPGWEIEDCFLLTRSGTAARPRQAELFGGRGQYEDSLPVSPPRKRTCSSRLSCAGVLAVSIKEYRNGSHFIRRAALGSA